MLNHLQNVFNIHLTIYKFSGVKVIDCSNVYADDPVPLGAKSSVATLTIKFEFPVYFWQTWT